MRNILPVVTLLYVCFIQLSFKSHGQIQDFVKISPSFYASKTEVNNKEYRDFLDYLQLTGQQDRYKICLYDSLKWKQFKGEYEVMAQYYHRHAVYNAYPVVNITKPAMELYCVYKTQQYNSMVGRKYNKVLFRLPSESEWKKIASPSGKPDAADNNPPKKDKANIRDKEMIESPINETLSITGPVFAYPANTAGVYNIFGNVSEMTTDGLVKGGSWDTEATECGVDKIQNYALPDPRVGFRLVMEVIAQ